MGGGHGQGSLWPRRWAPCSLFPSPDSGDHACGLRRHHGLFWPLHAHCPLHFPAGKWRPLLSPAAPVHWGIRARSPPSAPPTPLCPLWPVGLWARKGSDVWASVAEVLCCPGGGEGSGAWEASALYVTPPVPSTTPLPAHPPPRPTRCALLCACRAFGRVPGPCSCWSPKPGAQHVRCVLGVSMGWSAAARLVHMCP